MTEIILTEKNVEATIFGVELFTIEPGSLLTTLEIQNREPGRYRSSEAAFDHLAISLYGFSILGEDGKIEVLSAVDPRAEDRSITLRASPYVSGEPGFRRVSVV